MSDHVFALEALMPDDAEAGDGRYDSEFARFRQQLMQTCMESAQRLRAGCFSGEDEDFIVLVTVSDDDEPAQVLNERVARLNPPAIAQEYLAWSRTWGSY